MGERVFTEAEVRALIGVAMAAGRQQGQVPVDDVLASVEPTIPPDEPVFLLRASEPGAVNLLAAIYNSDGFNDGAGYIRDPEHYRELVGLQFAFADWLEAR